MHSSLCCLCRIAENRFLHPTRTEQNHACVVRREYSEPFHVHSSYGAGKGNAVATRRRVANSSTDSTKPKRRTLKKYSPIKQRSLRYNLDSKRKHRSHTALKKSPSMPNAATTERTARNTIVTVTQQMNSTIDRSIFFREKNFYRSVY